MRYEQVYKAVVTAMEYVCKKGVPKVRRVCRPPPARVAEAAPPCAVPAQLPPPHSPRRTAPAPAPLPAQIFWRECRPMYSFSERITDWLIHGYHADEICTKIRMCCEFLSIFLLLAARVPLHAAPTQPLPPPLSLARFLSADPTFFAEPY